MVCKKWWCTFTYVHSRHTDSLQKLLLWCSWIITHVYIFWMRFSNTYLSEKSIGPSLKFALYGPVNVNIGLNKGLASIRLHAMIWSNDGLVCRIYGSSLYPCVSSLTVTWLGFQSHIMLPSECCSTVLWSTVLDSLLQIVVRSGGRYWQWLKMLLSNKSRDQIPWDDIKETRRRPHGHYVEHTVPSRLLRLPRGLSEAAAMSPWQISYGGRVVILNLPYGFVKTVSHLIAIAFHHTTAAQSPYGDLVTLIAAVLWLMVWRFLKK